MLANTLPRRRGVVANLTVISRTGHPGSEICHTMGSPSRQPCDAQDSLDTGSRCAAPPDPAALARYRAQFCAAANGACTQPDSRRALGNDPEGSPMRDRSPDGWADGHAGVRGLGQSDRVAGPQVRGCPGGRSCAEHGEQGEGGKQKSLKGAGHVGTPGGCWGALTGNFNATLDYVGAGGDVYGHAETAGGWAGNLELPQIHIGSRPTKGETSRPCRHRILRETPGTSGFGADCCSCRSFRASLALLARVLLPRIAICAARSSARRLTFLPSTSSVRHPRRMSYRAIWS